MDIRYIKKCSILFIRKIANQNNNGNSRDQEDWKKAALAMMW